jgi:hypothetical protein
MPGEVFQLALLRPNFDQKKKHVDDSLRLEEQRIGGNGFNISKSKILTEWNVTLLCRRRMHYHVTDRPPYAGATVIDQPERGRELQYFTILHSTVNIKTPVYSYCKSDYQTTHRIQDSLMTCF